MTREAQVGTIMIGHSMHMPSPQVRGERCSLNPHAHAKWSEQRKLRDTRKAMCFHAQSQRTESSPSPNHVPEATAEDNHNAEHPGPNSGEARAATPDAIPEHSDPADFKEPLDALERPAAPRADGPRGPAAAAALRRVRFAAQLEEDPPAVLHSPRPARPGGRGGALAARMLRAVSRSFTRALRRAPG